MSEKDKKLNDRQAQILQYMSYQEEFSLGDILGFFNDQDRVSNATLRRDLVMLCDLKFIEKRGELKSTTYTITVYGLVHAPMDAQHYVLIDPDMRIGNTKFNHELFSQFPDDIFSDSEIKTLNDATNIFFEKSKNISETIQKKELERFVIELSWKSSKIEGNTYTLLDTERLLVDGIEATGHSKDEATMILNHKKAFDYIIKHIHQYKYISVSLIEDIHKLLVIDLGISYGLRSVSVGVTGSRYVPIAIPVQIKSVLQELCDRVNTIDNPYVKVLLMLVGISYVQPFEDGNKRTARMVTNALLMAYACAPLSYRSVDEVSYRESMLVFYEKNSIGALKKIFIEQYLFACEHYLKF